MPMHSGCASQSLDSNGTVSTTHVRQVSSVPRSASRQMEITRAVWAYLKATRTLGTKTRANTTQIAEALSLPRRAVDRALLSLGERGIKAPQAIERAINESPGTAKAPISIAQASTGDPTSVAEDSSASSFEREAIRHPSRIEPSPDALRRPT